jgi:hypothetical protein
MLVKSKLVIAAALILTAASAAQAASDNEPEEKGGFVWGPMGQRMGGNPAWHRSLGGKRHEYSVSRGGFRAYGFAPSTRYRYQRNDY